MSRPTDPHPGDYPFQLWEAHLLGLLILTTEALADYVDDERAAEVERKSSMTLEERKEMGRGLVDEIRKITLTWRLPERTNPNDLLKVNQRLHRRCQEAESALAQATPAKVQALDEALAREKVEKHKYRNAVKFMQSERQRLKRRIADLEAGRG